MVVAGKIEPVVKIIEPPKSDNKIAAEVITTPIVSDTALQQQQK